MPASTAAPPARQNAGDPGGRLILFSFRRQSDLLDPDPVGGIVASFVKFGGIFAFTQIPLAISEGLLTVLVINLIRQCNARDLQETPVASEGVPV